MGIRLYGCDSKTHGRYRTQASDQKNGEWIDVDEHPALDLIHKVNKFMSFYELWYATYDGTRKLVHPHFSCSAVESVLCWMTKAMFEGQNRCSWAGKLSVFPS